MISDKNWISFDISKFLIDSFPPGEHILTEMNGANSRLLPAWFNVRKFSIILKYEVKIDAVTCSRVHSGL